MKFFLRTLIILVAITGLSSLFHFATTPNEGDKEFQQRFNEAYSIYALKLPEQITFAGEAIPSNDFDLVERLDKELHVNTYWQSNSLLNFKRSNRYFPMIDRILKEEGIPADFKYLALTESGLQQVVSPAGATGFWQIMKSTGKELGLEINSEVDERYHLEKSTRAACKYLQESYEQFGSWTLVAASYNMGKAGLNRALKKQKVKSYYDLLLNSETSRYVFRIHALKEIIENPKKYGFHFTNEDLYPPLEYDEITVDQEIEDIAVFAKHIGCNYKQLKNLNPWLRKNELSMRYSDSYVLQIPKGLKLPENLYEIPEDTTTYGVIVTDDEGEEVVDIAHYVKKGENLSIIASKYGVSVKEIMDWNNLKSSSLKIGQKLIIEQIGD